MTNEPKPKGELFERRGDKLERVTSEGQEALVSAIWDRSGALSDAQRSTGNYYGACYEAVFSGGSSSFMREVVDGGSGGAGQEGRMDLRARVVMARNSLAEMPACVYRAGVSPSYGKHAPIMPIQIVDRVCIASIPVTAVCREFGWTSLHDGKVTVPNRQRKRVLLALSEALDVIRIEWERVGVKIPGSDIVFK